MGNSSLENRRVGLPACRASQAAIGVHLPAIGIIGQANSGSAVVDGGAMLVGAPRSVRRQKTHAGRK